MTSNDDNEECHDAKLVISSISTLTTAKKAEIMNIILICKLLSAYE